MGIVGLNRLSFFLICRVYELKLFSWFNYL